MKTSKSISEHAHAAKLIKAELKAAFPGTKFSVKSDSYSGGDSVRIDYEDGPLYKDVMDRVRKYQYGSFNSMEDIYEMTNGRTDIPQTKYVLVQRSKSDAVTEVLVKEIAATYAGCEELTKDNYWNVLVPGWEQYGSVLVNRLFSERAF